MKKHLRDLIALARDLGVEDAKVRKGGKHPIIIGTTPGWQPLAPHRGGLAKRWGASPTQRRG